MILAIIKIKPVILKEIIIVINIKIVNKKFEGHISCERNYYPAAQGGELRGYSYGRGGNSNTSDVGTAQNGNAGAVIIQYVIAIV